MRENYAVIGLGNPGSAYEHTRHNVGFDVLDTLAVKTGITLQRKRFSGLVAEGDVQGRHLILGQPLTYMNLSGEFVAPLCSWYKVQPDHLLLIYDDIDLPQGRLRMRGSGSAGTHNGIRSVIGQLGRQDFPRLRIGIGGCPPAWDLKDWVLSKYRAEDRVLMRSAFELAAETVLLWMEKGTDAAMRLANADPNRPQRNGAKPASERTEP